jgi:histidyl-tRNA synthetase
MTDRGMFPPAVAGGVVDVVVTFLDDDSRVHALRLAAELRAEKLRVDVFPDVGRKFEKPLKYASARGAKLMAILGENERTKNEVTVRDLTTREQTAVSRGDAVAFVRQHLAP